MSFKADVVEVGLAIVVTGLALWYLQHRISKAGGVAAVADGTVSALTGAVGDTVSGIDGGLTGAVTSIPVVSSLVTDPSTGNFDPIAAGQAFGQATQDAIGNAWDTTAGWVSDLFTGGKGGYVGVSGPNTSNGIDLGTGPGWN